MAISSDAIFVLQLLGFIGVGGFIEEFYRTIYAGYSINRYFIANFLAGGFLSFLVAYSFYQVTGNKTMTHILGALLAYQDEKYLNTMGKDLLKRILNMKEEDNERTKKD